MELVAKLPTSAQDIELSKPEARLELVRKTLDANSNYIAQALGKFMTAERFARMVVTLVRGNKDLLECKPSTVVLSVLRIAQLQLSPDPALGQAWLIPRKGKAVFQIGYKGYLALAYRSRRVLAVRYGVVAKDDQFEWRDGRQFVLKHVPTENGWPANQGDTRAAWAILDLRGGGQVPRVMGLAEILRHKARGEGKQPAWTTDFAAQAAKTVIGDVCRRGPLEEEFGRALSWDEGEQSEDPELKDVTPAGGIVPAADTTTKAAAFVEAFGGGSASEPETESATDPSGDPGPGDDDFLGDALGADDGQPRDDAWPTPEPVPAHVRRVLDAGAAVGLTTPAQVSSILGDDVFKLPAALESEALRKLKALRVRK